MPLPWCAGAAERNAYVGGVGADRENIRKSAQTKGRQGGVDDINGKPGGTFTTAAFWLNDCSWLSLFVS